MSLRTRLALLALMLPVAAWAQMFGINDDARWTEIQAQLPEYPKTENYLPFKASATTPFDFYVDAKSINAGNDGVMRYSLIAKSSTGALNVSFEGIRCSQREYRIYAFGRADNTWSEARGSRWQPIPMDARNTQRTVLYNDFLCPGGVMATADEGQQALRNGGGYPQQQQTRPSGP